jgi:hypothetical protein
MLTGLFRPNQPGVLLLALPFIAILLWLPGLLHYREPIVTGKSMPLYEAVVFLLAGVPYLPTIVGVVLVILQALLLNGIINKNELLPVRTNLPALFYVLLMSSYIELQTMHPVLWSNLFLLFALDRIGTVYLQKTVFSQAFDTGALIAIASFFYFPAVVFFLFLWISLLIIRPFIWREYLISMIGLVLPYVFLFTWYFITGGLMEFIEVKIKADLDPTEIILPVFVAADYVLMLSLLILLGLSLASFPAILGKRVVKVQYILRSIIAMLVVSGMAVVADHNDHPFTITQSAIPVAFFFSAFFLTFKRKWLAEVVFFYIFGLIVLNFFM